MVLYIIVLILAYQFALPEVVIVLSWIGIIASTINLVSKIIEKRKDL